MPPNTQQRLDDATIAARKAFKEDDPRYEELQLEVENLKRQLKSEGRGQSAPADKPLWDWTEEGVADYFVMMYANDLRFVTGLGWYGWQGSYWKQDKDDGVYSCMRKVTTRLRKQAASMPTKTEEDERLAKAFRQFVKRMQTGREHEAVLRVASRDKRLRVKREVFDHQPALLPCLNGTLELATGKLREARQEDLLGRVVPVEFDPEAKSPMFDAFLREIQPDLEMREFLQRLLGYGLFGFVREHVFPIFYGEGANGKSVLAQVVQHIVGEYAQTVPRSLVVDTGREQHKTQIARLDRIRMGFIHETERDARLNVEAVKALTGGDVLTGHYMRQDFFDFTPTHTLYLLSNFKPQVDAAIQAVWRRLLLIPFDVEIAVDKQDLALPEKIIENESPGVLRWLVEGAALWWKNSEARDGASGLLPPKRVVDETREYQRAEDVIGSFVEDCCTLLDEAKVSGGNLYKAYKSYCEQEGIDKPASNNKFAEAVARVKGAKGKAIGKAIKGGDGRKMYSGIGLPAPPEDNRSTPDKDPGNNWDF